MDERDARFLCRIRIALRITEIHAVRDALPLHDEPDILPLGKPRLSGAFMIGEQLRESAFVQIDFDIADLTVADDAERIFL